VSAALDEDWSVQIGDCSAMGLPAERSCSPVSSRNHSPITRAIFIHLSWYIADLFSGPPPLPPPPLLRPPPLPTPGLVSFNSKLQSEPCFLTFLQTGPPPPPPRLLSPPPATSGLLPQATLLPPPMLPQSLSTLVLHPRALLVPVLSLLLPLQLSYKRSFL
jgi:hypothetical protein